nr:MAG TPA: hypothetical protein [Caudoviricetes sp.]
MICIWIILYGLCLSSRKCIIYLYIDKAINGLR